MSSKRKFVSCGEHKGVLVRLTGVFPGAPEGINDLPANSTEAATEKHIPEVTVDGSTVKVVVGSVVHPMSEEHLIDWILLETDKGILCRELTPTDKPEVTFTMQPDEKAVAVYEMCNLHGLWKTEL